MEKQTSLFKISTCLCILSISFFAQVSRAGDGASSGGGGGYVTDNARKLLARASATTAQSLRDATPAIFQNLPKPWTRERLARLIENVRLSPAKTNQRDNLDLMFDYGIDNKGPYIEALRPFFEVYGAVPVRFESDRTIAKIVMDLQIKLLHEAAHHMGLDEARADKFSVDAFQALDTDLIYCLYKPVADTLPPESPRPYYFFQRAFRRFAQPNFSHPSGPLEVMTIKDNFEKLGLVSVYLANRDADWTFQSYSRGLNGELIGIINGRSAAMGKWYNYKQRLTIKFDDIRTTQRASSGLFEVIYEDSEKKEKVLHEKHDLKCESYFRIIEL